ncbi:MAG: winged helix-turn-helix domain-containing protein [Candidatus Nanopelagicales bacterium]
MRELTPAQARRAALAASGFGRRLGSAPTQRQIVAAAQRPAMLQIDSVNVLIRAHYLPVYSRLGPYDRSLLDAAAGQSPRRLFEYWGHEASLLPVSTYPLLRWRMDLVHEHAWGWMKRVASERPELVREVADRVADRGPITATELEAELQHGADRRGDNWGWNWSEVKGALEYLFWSGEVSAAGRDGSFRRRYASTSAVLPKSVLTLPRLSEAAAKRELVRIAAGALGVARIADLADYFRIPAVDTVRAVGELVAEGVLEQVAIPGWPAATYSPVGMRVPRRVEHSALLVPFDPLLWERGRVEKLFGMRYRIEIYVPPAQRQYGYYVLPFLHKERLCARVDLKSDRVGSRLLVQAAWAEPDMTADDVSALGAELRLLAGWLGLSDVRVMPVGDLAADLAPQFA